MDSPATAATEETLDPEDWTGALELSQRFIEDAVRHLRDVREHPLSSLP